MSEKSIFIDDLDRISAIFGACDSNIVQLENEFNVIIVSREGEIRISGEEEPVRLAAEVVEYLGKISLLSGSVTEQNLHYAIGMVKSGKGEELREFDGDLICITVKGKPVKAKSVGQKKYIETIKKNAITIGVGPAGTGKTFLAVAMAVTALRNKEVNRIILTRPAVEAGEKLGFLPGDLQNKIDPYIRPLYDALYEMLGAENFARHFEKGTIEIAPLAYMRGRTLDDSFIILDEAQNTTPEQMKMFLTRLGFNSRAVVTGDITQIDLMDKAHSGLVEALNIISGIDGIGIHYLTSRDVVRHSLVTKIIEAYERAQKNKEKDREIRTRKENYKK